MPITVYFLCDHILGTEQLIILASFHCFSFQGPCYAQEFLVHSSLSLSCYLCVACVSYIVEGIWMNSKEKKSYGLS